MNDPVERLSKEGLLQVSRDARGNLIGFHFEGNDQEFGEIAPHLRDAKHLDMFGANVTDFSAEIWRTFQRAEVIEINCTPLASIGMQYFPCLPKLRQLSLSPGDDSERMIAIVCECHHIQHLSLSKTMVSSDSVSRIMRSLPRLSKLTLDICPQIDDSAFADCHSAAKLEELRISDCPISDAAGALIGRCPAISTLFVGGTDAGDRFVRGLANLSRLRCLGMPGTKITLESVKILYSTALQLEELNLSECRLGDECVATLSAMRRLSSLDVERTSISAAGLRRLKAALPHTEINH